VINQICCWNVLSFWALSHQNGWVTLIMAAILHLFGALAVIFNSARLVRFGEHLEPHTEQS
jgi:cation transport ATPase